MRIAVLIISLALALPMGCFSCVFTTSDAVMRAGDEAFADKDDPLADFRKDRGPDAAGPVGLLCALLLLFGGAFAYGQPKASMLLHLVGGCIAVMGGIGTEWKDLMFYSLLFFGLAVMDHYGVKEKERAATLSREK